MTFGEKLKEARKEAGLTQEELATKLSVSRQAVDTAIWLLTDAPPGTIELAQSWNNIDNAFYLVRRKEKKSAGSGNGRFYRKPDFDTADREKEI